MKAQRRNGGRIVNNGSISAQSPRPRSVGYTATRHVADAVVYMAELPLDANVQLMTVMATTMPPIGRG